MENQPCKPRSLALNAGASTVFIRVWPVLKSFPAIGVPVFFASSSSAGTSAERLGAPLAYGMPPLIAAYA